MDDLIDRKELLNNRPEYLNPQMEDEIQSARHKGWNDCNSYYYDLIIKQPKVDTERHAHWIKHKPNEEQMNAYHELGFGKAMSVKSIYWSCSNCNAWGTPVYKYCSNCGCKMKKVKEKE